MKRGRDSPVSQDKRPRVQPSLPPCGHENSCTTPCTVTPGATYTNSPNGGTRVTVEIVDLSNGIIRAIGEPLLGVKLDGIYHSSVHVHGREYWFHLDGPHQSVSTVHNGTHVSVRTASNVAENDEVKSAEATNLVEEKPGNSKAGASEGAVQGCTEHGFSEKSLEQVDAWYTSAKLGQYNANTYDLWTRNCNNFANELLTFLGVSPLPSSIMSVPDTILASPVGMMLRPTVDKALEKVRCARAKSGKHGQESALREVLATLAAEPGGFLIMPVIQMLGDITGKAHQDPLSSLEQHGLTKGDAGTVIP